MNEPGVRTIGRTEEPTQQRAKEGKVPFRERAEMGPVACTARTPAAGVRTIDTIAAEINGIKEQVRATVVSGAIEIGRRLKEAKSLVPYGEWGAWLERSVDYSERTAQNMMRIADEYGKTDPQALADLSVTQAVLLLGVSAEERGAFLAENDVPSMSTRELQAQIEALREEKKKMQLTIDELMQGIRDDELTDELMALQGDVGMMTDRAERAEQELERYRQEGESRAARAAEELAKARSELHEAEKRHLAAMEVEAGKVKAGHEEREKLKKERDEKQRQVEALERKLTRMSEELEESRNKAQTMETVPSVVREELERLRAQAGRTEAEGELRAAFNALRDAFARLKDGLDGAGAGVDKPRFRAAFVTALRLMADQMEGGEKQ